MFTWKLCHQEIILRAQDVISCDSFNSSWFWLFRSTKNTAFADMGILQRLQPLNWDTIYIYMWTVWKISKGIFFYGMCASVHGFGKATAFVAGWLRRSWPQKPLLLPLAFPAPDKKDTNKQKNRVSMICCYNSDFFWEAFVYFLSFFCTCTYRGEGQQQLVHPPEDVCLCTEARRFSVTINPQVCLINMVESCH